MAHTGRRGLRVKVICIWCRNKVSPPLIYHKNKREKVKNEKRKSERKNNNGEEK